jgi:hypothetical protein
MYKLLLLGVFTFSLNVSANQDDPLSVIKTHQTLLNEGKNEVALSYWLPSKQTKLSGEGFTVIAHFFSGFHFDDSKFSKNCKLNECKITAIANKGGKQSNVTYTLVKRDNVYYVSNIQATKT